jgi:hypothetical protein
MFAKHFQLDLHQVLKGYLKDRIFATTNDYPSAADITVAAEAAWANLPLDLCHSLMDSMHNRCKLIIEKHGVITRYEIHF